MNVVVMIMLMILANLLFMAVISDTTQSINTQSLINAKTQSIRNEADLEPVLKSELMLLIAQYGINPLDLEKGLAKVLTGTAPTDLSLRSSAAAEQAANYLTRWREIESGNRKIHVRAIASSLPLDPVSYIEYETCQEPNPGDPSATRRQRLRLRTSLKGGFTNAVTGQSMNCVFCHAHIYGNVGEYGSHVDTPPHSTRVYGNWFTAKNQAATIMNTNPTQPLFYKRTMAQMLDPAANPPSRPTDINPDRVMNNLPPMNTILSGVTLNKTQGDYDGPELPWNPQTKSRTLPKFDPRSMRALARGSITGGAISRVPYGGSFPGVPTTVDRVVEGNLILDGRTTPLVIQGRVFVTGDVILMGTYTGQGAIYAGRNIYIPQSLRAQNLAPVFNKTQAANLTMSQVSIPSQGLQISNNIWDYDRLMLVAANNVIIGNPYPYNATPKVINGYTYLDPEIGADIRYITRIVLQPFTDEIFYEKKTGYMALPSTVNGKLCLTLPWEDITRQCIEINPATGEYASNDRFIKTPVMTSVTNNDIDRSKMELGQFVPEAYWKNFFPMNVTDRNTGALSAWITQPQFDALTRRPADLAHASLAQGDSCGRRKRTLFMDIPYEKLPMDQQNLDPAWIANRIDTITKIFSRGANYKVRYRELGFGGTSEDYNARSLMERYLSLCLNNVAKGVPPSLPPALQPSITDAATAAEFSANAGCNPEFSAPGVHTGTQEPIITDAGQRFDPANFPPMPAQERAQFTCELQFFAEDATCSAGQKYARLNVYMMDYPQSYLMGQPVRYFCGNPGGSSYGRSTSCYRTLERRPLQTCNACNETVLSNGIPTTVYHPASECHPSCGCSSTAKSLYFWRSADDLIAPSATAQSPDVRITIVADADKLPTIRVLTRIWEPPYDAMIDNKIREIDAFLFANQFVSYAANSIHDRQLQINGGISSREFAGRLANRVGFDRPGEPPPYNYRHITGVMDSDDIGAVIMLDPRFQHIEDLIQEDFGTLELRESIAGGGATCP